MAGQRAKNKVSVGAYVDLGIDAGIRQWLDKFPRKTKTAFLEEAILEKLAREHINVPEVPNSSHSRLRKLPAGEFRHPPHVPKPYLMNDSPSSSATASKSGEALAGDVTKAALKASAPKPGAGSSSGKASPPKPGGRKRRDHQQ